MDEMLGGGGVGSGDMESGGWEGLPSLYLVFMNTCITKDLQQHATLSLTNERACGLI